MEPLTINELIAWIESRNVLGAVRFEDGMFGRITAAQTQSQALILARIVATNKCSAATARMIYSSSWGKYQIMGFNLYGDGAFDMPVMEFVASQRSQDKAFAKFITGNGLQDFTPGKLAKSHADRLKFAITYNGSIAYETPMVAALAHFGLTAVN